MDAASCRGERSESFIMGTGQLSLCWDLPQQTLHLCPALFRKSEIASQLAPQHLHLGIPGSFQTANEPFLQEMGCCVGYRCLHVPSRGGLRTTGRTAGDRGTGLSVCSAPPWGGQGACGSDEGWLTLSQQEGSSLCPGAWICSCCQADFS